MIDEAKLRQFAENRADDAGMLARELVEVRARLTLTTGACRAARIAFAKILTFNLVKYEAKREAINEICLKLDVAIAKSEAA